MRLWLLRVLLGCRDDEHLWRRLYGDERGARGAMFVCEHCNRRSDGPVWYHIDPTQDWVDDMKRRMGVEVGPWADGRLPSRPVQRKS